MDKNGYKVIFAKEFQKNMSKDFSIEIMYFYQYLKLPIFEIVELKKKT